MKTVNIIVGFDPITRKTLVPEGTDWVHITPEKGNTVCIQVRGEDAVIEAMKTDSGNLWLEDVEVKDAEIPS